MSEDGFFYGDMGVVGFMDKVFPILFMIIFFIILGCFVVNIVSSIMQWSKNNKQPIVPTNATVVSKRLSISHHNNSAENGHMTSSSTTYFVTFEFENSQRVEFRVKGSEYGRMVEGDFGVLHFQGTRFIEFTRKIV